MAAKQAAAQNAEPIHQTVVSFDRIRQPIKAMREPIARCGAASEFGSAQFGPIVRANPLLRRI